MRSVIGIVLSSSVDKPVMEVLARFYSMLSKKGQSLSAVSGLPSQALTLRPLFPQSRADFFVFRKPAGCVFGINFLAVDKDLETSIVIRDQGQ